MSNELLRIHDENNNCDLVAVANPMGNFHMSTYAEMQDGTQKPVDGWYLFSKMIEKLGQGGGGAFVIDIDDDDFENMCNDPDFGLTVWKAFQSGKQIYIGSRTSNQFKIDVVSNVRIYNSCSGRYLELLYIPDYSNQVNDDGWYGVPYITGISLRVPYEI